MSRCISHKNQLVINIAQDLNIHPAIVATKISLWQDKNNTDLFPSKNDLILNINLMETNNQVDLPSTIINFYSSLSDEEKLKIGNIEKLYSEQIFPMEDDEFIDMLKCKI